MPAPHFHWFLPMDTDDRDLLPLPGRERRATPDYMLDLARAVERNGFESILLATGRRALDTWLLAASLIAGTRSLRFLVAMRPGLALPALTAQMAATFQALSGNRLDLNIVSGSFDDEQRAYGDFLDKTARYARTAEFIELLRRCWTGEPFSHAGEHYRIEGGGLAQPLAAPPTLFFGGSSPQAQAVAARHADVHLIYGEPPPMAREQVQALRTQAAALGRTLRFGIRMQVITRPTSAEAWREAERLLAGIGQAQIDAAQQALRRRQSVGQARVQSVHAGRKDDPEALKIYPTVWAGTGLVDGGGGSTALVGSHAEVAERIREYQSIGIEHFILSGFPRLESAYEFGEGVIPLFRAAAAQEALA